MVKFGVVRGLSEAARHARQLCRACYLASCECVVKFPGTGPSASPTHIVVKFGVFSGLSEVARHARQEVRLLGPGFAKVDCRVVVTNELQAEFICEHVECAKALVGTRVVSVGFHDYVSVVHGSNEILHEEYVDSGSDVSSCSGMQSGLSCPRLPGTCNKRQS